MGDRMLVTQALDERDLLEKRIRNKIDKGRFVDTVKPNEEKVFDARLTRDDFTKEASSAYQQIMDLIERYQKIDAAIVASNAATVISTSYGDYTVAGAISLRSRLRGVDPFSQEMDFETSLQNKLQRDFEKCVNFSQEKNGQLKDTAENMRLSILGKDTKVKDDKPLGVVDTYVRENTTELFDPLGVEKKIADMKEKRETLLTELDTKIKVSNATTFIEF